MGCPTSSRIWDGNVKISVWVSPLSGYRLNADSRSPIRITNTSSWTGNSLLLSTSISTVDCTTLTLLITFTSSIVAGGSLAGGSVIAGNWIVLDAFWVRGEIPRWLRGIVPLVGEANVEQVARVRSGSAQR